MDTNPDFIFEVMTPLGFHVHTTPAYWDVITKIKHPIMTGRIEDVKETLSDPDEIRQSKKDSDVYLFYKGIKERQWICVVAKDDVGSGFVITAYPTSAIKEGELVWRK